MLTFIDSKRKKLIDFILSDYLDLTHLHSEQYTKVVHHILVENDIPHKCYIGSVIWQGRTFTPHAWIVSGDILIDFRLRAKLGNPSLPEGVFHLLQVQHLSYAGFNYPMQITDAVFELLLKGPAEEDELAVSER